MTFLNPLVLLGLAAAAIPLIIHLFNFRRPQRVDFSSLAFLKELQQTTMQRVRIKQWLLLLLRTLAIAALVLAFARPTLTSDLAGTLGGQAPTAVAVVVDNSLSMTLRDARGAYLEQARDVAAALIEQGRPGDEVFVLPVAGMPERPAPFRNVAPALDAVAELQAGAGAASAERAVARAAALLGDTDYLNRELYLVSDLQQSTWTDTLATDLPPDLRTVLVPVGSPPPGNVGVTDVQVLSRIVEAGQPVRLEATLTNYGDEPLRDYVASLYLGGERVAQAAVDLEPGVGTRAAFTATPSERGWLEGVVEVEDDAFASDNVRYFTLHVPERRRVLVVRGEGQRTDFLELALSPELGRGRVAFDTDVVGEDALAATALGAYDAVLLVGPRTLSSGETASLARYVATGGGVLVTPAAGAETADYDALLDALGGGRLAGFSGAAGSGRPIAGFDQVDLEHPLFEGMFTRLGGGAAQVESPDVYFAANYAPGGGTEQTLIRLSTGTPFLQELRHGRGAAFFLSVAPDAAWSDLPVRGLFVPLLYRSMYYLSSSESVAGEQLVVGQPGELRLAGVDEAATVRLVAPDGEELTPEQRSLFGATLVQVGGDVPEPGIYDVRAGERLVRRVAFNPDARESDLAVLSPDEAAERLAEATGTTPRLLQVDEGGAARVAAALQAERTGVELWNVCLLLALVFLVAEMLVARRWRPETAPA